MRRSCRALLSTALLGGCVAPPAFGVRPGYDGPTAPPPTGYYRPAPAPAAFADTVRNPIVRDIQRQLRRHGYYPGPTSGIDTRETAAAIQAFQASHSLPPDGVASPHLLSVLRNTPLGS